VINAKYSTWKTLVGRWMGAYIWLAGALIAVVALIQKDPVAAAQYFPQWLVPVLSWTGINSWLIVLFLTVTGALAKLGRDSFNAAFIWTLIQDVIDRVAREAFPNLDGLDHHHRATLFRYQQWCVCPTPVRLWWWPYGRGRWPNSGWLVPIVRSGHATQKSRTVFLAPDDADHVEGVAGAVWASGKLLEVACAKAIDPSASVGDINTYSAKTWVTSEWVQQQVDAGKVLSASFKGIPIEVRGQKWGVLLLDSRNPKGAIDAPLNVTNHAYILGKLLERT